MSTTTRRSDGRRLTKDLARAGVGATRALHRSETRVEHDEMRPGCVMRGDRPSSFSNLKSGDGVDRIANFILEKAACMTERFVSRGFRGRRQQGEFTGRVPPGQYVESGFPVLSAGPTPRTPLDRWNLSIEGKVDRARRWTWSEFHALPRESVTKDIHCVTKWTKLDTHWEGVSVDTLLAGLEVRGRYVIGFCDGGYTTNLPLHDLTGGKAFVVDTYEGHLLAPEHGGPVRLLVPHLYFWKSAKWLRGLRVVEADEPGFWESLGYHNHGDPWKEERYSGD